MAAKLELLKQGTPEE